MFKITNKNSQKMEMKQKKIKIENIEQNAPTDRGVEIDKCFDFVVFAVFSVPN